MINISRAELTEIAHIVVVANTPFSLVKGLRRSFAMDKLRQWTPEELCHYYDRLTVRVNQSEITIALAYAVAISIVLRAQNPDAIVIDLSRLHWGEQIRHYLITAETTSATQNVKQPRATVEIENVPSAGFLYGPDDRPISWRA